MGRNGNIHYPRLKEEMRIRNVSIGSIALMLGRNRDTISDKLAKKTEISLKEANDIKRVFFPDIDLEVLFADEEE